MATKQIKDLPATKQFVCEIPSDEITKKTESELLKIAQTAEIKGFRKGHIPMKMVKELYSEKAKSMAVDILIRDKIEMLAKEGNYKLSASPSVDEFKEEEGKIEFTVTFELMPEIPSNFDFSQIKAKTYEVALSEEEIQKELELIAERNRTFAKKEGKAEKGDVVVIDTIGRVDGVEFAGGKLDNYELELGSGTFIPGFEDQLIGVGEGENVIVTVTFPADYHAKDLASKESQFFTKVKEVKKAEKAEINDELAKKLSCENLGALKDLVKEKITSFYQNSHKDSLKGQIFEDLSKALTFDVSEGMVKRVAESMMEEKKLTPEDLPSLEDEAKRRLRLSLFLNHIASEEKIKVSDQDFTNFIIQNASSSGMNPFQMLEFYTKNKDARKKLELLLEEDKIYEFIFDKASIEKEQISKEKFDEILKIKH
jgi:trigger factor